MPEGVAAVIGVADEDEDDDAIPKISDMCTADFDEMFLAAMARARCLYYEIRTVRYYD